MTTQLRWKMCFRKRKFRNKQSALSNGQRAYPCPICRQWHRHGPVTPISNPVLRKWRFQAQIRFRKCWSGKPGASRALWLSGPVSRDTNRSQSRSNENSRKTRIHLNRSGWARYKQSANQEVPWDVFRGTHGGAIIYGSRGWRRWKGNRNRTNFQ